MPKRTFTTGLQRLRAVAPEETLVNALAQEPTDTLGPDATRAEPHPNQQISSAEQHQMFREWAAGANIEELELRYGVSRGYLRQAMQRRFGSREAMLAALQNLVCENAVGTQMIAQAKMHELNAAQAVFAGKLLVETMVKLDEHIQARPKTVSFDAFAKLGKVLKDVRRIVGPSSHPNVPTSE